MYQRLLSSTISSISLTAKPSAPFEGIEIARLIREAITDGNLATLEDGPLGGTPLDLGDVRIGEMLSGPIGLNEQWPLFRIADHSVAQVVHLLVANSTLWLPGMSKAEAIPVAMCKLEELGDVGPYHLDVDGSGVSGGAARGPFKVRPVKAGHSATFPVLDSHEMEKERTLEISYDAEGVPRVGKSANEKSVLEERRERIWATRSRLHLNTDFRFNSQSLAFALTKEETIGGRAWPSFKMKKADHDIIASLWWNSTLGILSYWWSANKSQDGRGSITTTHMPKLAMLDPRKLTADQMKAARAFFQKSKSNSFLVAHQIATDATRAALDEFVLRELLKVPNLPTAITRLATLRKKLGDEPSFNGGKD